MSLCDQDHVVLHVARNTIAFFLKMLSLSLSFPGTNQGELLESLREYDWRTSIKSEDSGQQTELITLCHGADGPDEGVSSAEESFSSA